MAKRGAWRVGGLSRAALAHAVLSVAGNVFSLVAEVHQGGHVPIRPDDNIAAPAAVAAVGSARGHVFFPVEGNRSVAAVPGRDPDRRFVNKQGILLFPLRLPPQRTVIR